MADARDGQAGVPPDALAAGDGAGEMPQARSGWPLRRVVLAAVSLAVAGGLAAAVLALAGPRSRPVHYKMAARFAYPGFQVGAMAITPDGKTLYVIGTDSAADNSAAYQVFPPPVVVPISLVTGVAGKPIPVGRQPAALAVTPNGKTLYVASYTSSTVTPVDTATGVPGKPITAGDGPDALAVTPDSKILYVASTGSDLSGMVTPVSAATGRPGKPITIGGGVTALAVAPDGTTLYAASIASDSSGTVTPVSTATGTPGTPVSVGMEPLALAITPDGASLFAAAFMGTPVEGFSTVSAVTLARSP